MEKLKYREAMWVAQSKAEIRKQVFLEPMVSNLLV